MSDETWKYLTNQFTTTTDGSYKRANILNNDHMSKLTAENADADIAALETRTQPLSTAYGTAYTAWVSAKATYKGHTQLYDSLLDNLSSQKIKEWDIQIQGTYLEGTPEYTMILPDRRGPFQNGGKDDRLSEVQALADRLLSYPALAATQADVAAYATSMQTARDDQQQKEELVAMASDTLEQARLELCTMMYGNLGALMDKYRETPNVIENFWQLDLIRTTGGGGDDDDLPTTAVTISGTVRDAATLNPLAGVTVLLYEDGATPDTGIEVVTDVNGNYTLFIEDLPGTYSAILEANSSGYLSDSRPIALEPGEEYLGEDFDLSPTP